MADHSQICVDHCSLCTVYLYDRHMAILFFGSGTSVCNELSLTVGLYIPRMDHQLVLKLMSRSRRETPQIRSCYHGNSDKIFHMSCDGVLEYGHMQVVYAINFAAQLVCFFSCSLASLAR